MEGQSKQNINHNAIDLAKFVMSIAVVATHTEPLWYFSNSIMTAIYRWFISLAVPFFFLASGYLLAKKMTYPYKSEEDIYRVKKYLWRIIKMYVCWMIIYTPIAIYYFVSSKMSFPEAILRYIRGFFFVGEQYNSWQLWYLLSTIYALSMIMVLLQKKVETKYIVLISLLVALISICFNAVVRLDGELPLTIYILKFLIKCIMSTGRILLGMVYIPIGMLLADRRIASVLNWVLFIGGGIVYCLTSYMWLKDSVLIISAIGFFGIIERSVLKRHSIYPVLRKMSTIIYLIHMYVWTFYCTVISTEKMYGIDDFVFTIAVTLVIAMGYIFLKRNE